MKLNSKIAPLTVGVFPLMKKDGLDDKARDITESLKNEIICEYDDSGSIGKRYARMDEIGTPWCITVDYDSSRDKKVTIRDIDTTKQKRIKITDVDDVIKSLLAGKTKFDEA